VNSEELKPILTKITHQLVDTLVKVDGEFGNHKSAISPSFGGFRKLIEKSLPLLSKAGNSEIKKLIVLTRTAKDYFDLQIKNETFATCFVLINNTTAGDLHYEFVHEDFVRYFDNTFNQISIKRGSGKSSSHLFDHVMIDQRVDGFSANTFTRFTAEKRNNGEIKIVEQPNPGKDDPVILAEIGIDRNIIIEAVNDEWKAETLFAKSQEIKANFAQYAEDLYKEYEKLMDTFAILVSVLNNEMETRENFRPASYIQLPFNEKMNNEVIDFIYKSLNGKCFKTSKENFKKIFTPDNSFHKINWEWKVNTFVHLFTGFNFEYDGFSVAFPGIMKNSPNRWVTLADKFHIERRSEKTPLAKYLEITRRKGKRPIEMINLLPTINQLKKGWYN
jgi:hypothetical protein